MAYAFNVETLYDKTDNGLEILKYFLGSCKDFDKALQNQNNKFQLRSEENTPSAILIKPSKNIKSSQVNYWRIKDFGDDFFTPIAIAMQYTGLEFYPCLKRMYEVFNLVEGKSFFQADTEMKTIENDKRADGWFNVVLKDTHTDLIIIGNFVTPELAKEYHFYSVDYYEKVFINKKTKLKTYIKVTATESFPIFAFAPDGKKWYKTYAPLSNDKQYKHGYLGTKPDRYIHGLERLKNAYEAKMKAFDKEIIKAQKEENEFHEISLIKEKANFKFRRAIGATGGSDGLNIASLEEFAIWYNSESEQINYHELIEIQKYVHEFYNLPDIDTSGVKYGYEVAESHWTMKTIWLPKQKLGTNGKDFRNWMHHYQNATLKTIQFKFQNLINGALKMEFFERSDENKPYKIKPSYLHYFLKVKGFYLYYPEKSYTDKVAEQEYIFIQIIDNIVWQTFPNEIRKFCERYLVNRGEKVEVIDLIKSSVQFSDKNLLGIDAITLDFKKYTDNSQSFFFKNLYANVTAEKIELKPYKNFDKYVWNNAILQNDVFLENPFFKHSLDENGTNKVEILRTDCEYMNFLINTSRMFWRKELEEPFAPNQQEEKQAYLEANRFNLIGDCLTSEEKHIQEMHFLNKCYAIGYMTHRSKVMSFAKMLYVMDDKPKDSEDDSNGRTGKSLFFFGFEQLIPNRFIIDGKNKNITLDKHLLHGLTKENDFVYIEDLELYGGINFFYNWVTNSITVNPKQTKPYEIRFMDSPKIAISTNFGLPKMDSSSIGRILFTSFSDYYHIKNDNYLEQRKVNSDFDGVDLFSSAWNSKQWNNHYNFLMQCTQFYLQNRTNEISAPQNNIDINNAMASMGDVFMEWCESYFQETQTIKVERQIQNLTETVTVFEEETIIGTLNEYVSRNAMQKSYSDRAGKFSKTSANFKKSLLQYCKIHGYVLNPADLIGSDGKIKMPIIDEKGKRQIVEHFYIRTPTLISAPGPEAPETEKLPSEDLPF